MRITPLDVRKQDFARSMRGFDCDEVRAFLNTLADEYEAVLMDSKQIRERTLELEDKLGEYHSLEKNLRDTLLTAERLTQESRDAAAREGELVIRDAELKARGVMEECRMRTDELRRELIGLRREKENYLARFRSLAEAQVQFIDSHRTDFEDLDRRLGDIADAVVSRVTPGAALPNPSPMAAPWGQPAAYGPAPTAPYAAPAPAAAWGPPAPPYPTPAAPYAAPHVNTSPVRQPAAPAPSAPFAPAAPAAPVAKGPSVASGDVWRDYVPGRSTQAPAPAAGSPVPAATRPAQAPANVAEEDVNGLIAHSLVETPAPVHGPEAQGGEQESWRPEPVVTEVANL